MVHRWFDVSLKTELKEYFIGQTSLRWCQLSHLLKWAGLINPWILQETFSDFHVCKCALHWIQMKLGPLMLNFCQNPLTHFQRLFNADGFGTFLCNFFLSRTIGETWGYPDKLLCLICASRNNKSTNWIGSFCITGVMCRISIGCPLSSFFTEQTNLGIALLTWSRCWMVSQVSEDSCIFFAEQFAQIHKRCHCQWKHIFLSSSWCWASQCFIEFSQKLAMVLELQSWNQGMTSFRSGHRFFADTSGWSQRQGQ